MTGLLIAKPVKPLAPFRILTTMNSAQHLQHLYWRAGFGPRPQDVAAGLSPRKALRQLLHDSEKYEPLVGPSLSYTDPQGMAMTDPASIKSNPVPNGMVTTPDQPAAPGTPGPSVAPMRPRAAFRGGTIAAGVPRLRRADLTPEQRKMQNAGIRDAFNNMSTAWMERMATSPAQLREEMCCSGTGTLPAACASPMPPSACTTPCASTRWANSRTCCWP